MAKVRTYSTPSKLYRYRSIRKLTIAREIEAITQGFLCPKFSQMNDPMEGSHRQSVAYLVKVPRDCRRAILDKRDKLGIASLSEVVDHEPMWAHYADQFKGICIEYSTQKLLSNLDDDVDLVRMAYNEEPPILLSSKETDAVKARSTLATKTVRWASEREWRLISPSVGRAEYSVISSVTKVLLGARIPAAYERTIRHEMAELNIPVVKMKIHKYLIEFSKDGAD